MIGVFDSGYGGLTVLREFLKKLPEYSYVYLGDNAREPYGSHSEDEIFQFTLEGIEFLFSQGCKLVVLACNTASAGALRKFQQEVLPVKYPDKKVLGILVPTIEMLTGIPWQSPVRERSFASKQKDVAVLATEATVRSGAYTKEIAKRNANIEVFEQACPDLTTLIVAEGTDEEIRTCIKKYLRELDETMEERGVTRPLDSVFLGCTHFALIKDLVRKELPKEIELYEQSEMVAEALGNFLERHPEIKSRLDKSGRRRFLTTGDVERVSRLGSKYFGQQIKFEPVSIKK